MTQITLLVISLIFVTCFLAFLLILSSLVSHKKFKTEVKTSHDYYHCRNTISNLQQAISQANKKTAQLEYQLLVERQDKARRINDILNDLRAAIDFQDEKRLKYALQSLLSSWE